MNVLSSFHIFSTFVKYISSFHPLICPSLRLGQHRWSGRWLFDYPVGGSGEPAGSSRGTSDANSMISWVEKQTKHDHEILWCKFHGSLELHILWYCSKSWLRCRVDYGKLFFWTPSTKLEAIWFFKYGFNYWSQAVNAPSTQRLITWMIRQQSNSVI